MSGTAVLIARQIDVERSLHSRWQAGLHTHFRRAEIPSLLGTPHHFLYRQEIAFLGPMAAAERAKAAALHADVGEVDVPVYYVSDSLANFPASEIISRRDDSA